MDEQMPMNRKRERSETALEKLCGEALCGEVLCWELHWLPDMDLNHDKQIQSLLCYRYTIGQVSASKGKDLIADSQFEFRK